MDILDKIDFPPMLRVRQKFNPTRLRDVERSIRAQIRALGAQLPIRPGLSVALACPSRGLADYPPIVKSVVAGLRELKLVPFIIPAMGSHGAATASGQEKVLCDLEIIKPARPLAMDKDGYFTRFLGVERRQTVAQGSSGERPLNNLDVSLKKPI